MHRVVTFALCLTAAGALACGRTETEQSDEARAGVAPVDPPEANNRGSQLGDGGPTAASPAIGDRSSRLSTEELTLEYLEGTWCFAREGGGESGVIIFYADRTYRVGIGGTVADHYLEEPQDLETFWQRNDVVEVEPDRFVALLSHSYPVIYERAPC